MRRFSTEYLRETRRGMWDDREALSSLSLSTRRCVLDVGSGTGELSRVLAAETDGRVVGVDADPDLLSVADERVPVVAGDATRLPFADAAADLVVCQALLINLPDPEAAIREFARVSSDLVAAIEPDNSAVVVESSVDGEPRLERRARRAYVNGVETDVTLGGERTHDLFADAGLVDVSTDRYDHERTVAPPYSDRTLAAAGRKATGAGLADDRRTMLASALAPEEYDTLRTDWREMGREVVDQMRDREYRRTEIVPFFVTVGRVR